MMKVVVVVVLWGNQGRYCFEAATAWVPAEETRVRRRESFEMTAVHQRIYRDPYQGTSPRYKHEQSLQDIGIQGTVREVEY